MGWEAEKKRKREKEKRGKRRGILYYIYTQTQQGHPVTVHRVIVQARSEKARRQAQARGRYARKVKWLSILIGHH